MTERLFAVLFGTFVSEDVTCIAAGLMVNRGELPLVPAVVVCAIGIWLGDLALWAGGRAFGSRVLAMPRVRELIPAAGVDRFAAWFDRHAAAVIVGSRFTPGTRLPLYLGAGASGTSFLRFAVWSLVAVALWTPVLVGLSAWLGEQVARRAGAWIAAGTAVSFALALLALTAWRLAMRAVSRYRLAQKE